MGKITSYPKISKLLENNVFLIDGAGQGTHTITAKDIAVELLKLLDSKEQVGNLKMDELDQITSMLPTDKVLVGTESGVKAMSAKNALFDVLDIDSTISLEMRKNTFRGNNLGSNYTDEQQKEIRNGTFRGLFPGDYWENDGIKWRIVDIDYWYHTGCTSYDSTIGTNPGITDHHVVIMPDDLPIQQITNRFININNDLSNGARNSTLYTDILVEAKNMIYDMFLKKNILPLYNVSVSKINASTGAPSYKNYLEDSSIDFPSMKGITSYSGVRTYNNGAPMEISGYANPLSLFRLDQSYIYPDFDDTKNKSHLLFLNDIRSSDSMWALWDGGIYDLKVIKNENQQISDETTKYYVRPIFGLI